MFEDGSRHGLEWAQRALAAAEQAYRRLLELAEQDGSGQLRTVARFLASTFYGQDFPFDLRTVDVDTGDELLVCLDALWWAMAHLHKLVPEGERRILAICRAGGLQWSDA